MLSASLDDNENEIGGQVKVRRALLCAELFLIAQIVLHTINYQCNAMLYISTVHNSTRKKTLSNRQKL